MTPALLLPARLVRRGALLLCLSTAAYVAIEVLSYRSTYPDEASRQQLARLADTPAVRLLQGVPRAVETVGGFVVWDAGWLLALLLGTWSLLATTRVLRGEEDAGRGDLLLARPVTAVRLLLLQVGVLAAAVVLFGATVTVVLLAHGLPVSGSVLLGAALAGFGGVTVATAALAAQLLDLRRRAVAATVTALGLWFALRMVASSSDERASLLWLTPFGWLDLSEPFAAERWPVLLLPLSTAAALLALAVRERVRRDAGGARLRWSDRRRPRLHLLGTPAAFAWRSGAGVLTGWVAGTFAFGLVMGALVPSVVELLEEDEQYRRTLEDLGIDVSSPVDGFLAAMALSLAVVFVLQVVFRLGAVRTEEDSGRAELLLVRAVGRRRWLLGAAALSLVASTLVLLATSAGVASGGALTGAGLGASDVVVPFLATLPVVALFGGLAVLVFGTVPRLTVVLPASLAVVAYLLNVVGPLLELPDVVLDASPFAWLPTPGEPWPAAAAAVLLATGVAASLLGAELFARRDVVGD